MRIMGLYLKVCRKLSPFLSSSFSIGKFNGANLDGRIMITQDKVRKSK